MFESPDHASVRPRRGIVQPYTCEGCEQFVIQEAGEMPEPSVVGDPVGCQHGRRGPSYADVLPQFSNARDCVVMGKRLVAPPPLPRSVDVFEESTASTLIGRTRPCFDGVTPGDTINGGTAESDVDGD
ncbi:hypothetical protein [Limnoglobus roseus]|uniref:hypothetical protein n=1 Tax=Limnoglobus roseus TaxID=2598579 RepID=UPI0011EB86D9|nr:hypothetical protein [Limnoglobus roseus]